jgi:DNA-binding GntR family transcriptional regulator
MSKIVTDRLRDAILSNQLKVGEIYSEKELALQFGVSRTPVREAMRVLLAEKIVVPVAGRGIKINSFSARDLEEVFELRKTLEVAVVEKIANNINLNKNNLDAPRKYLEEQRRAFMEGDYSQIIHLNRLFHTSLCLIGGNSRMESVLNQTLDIIQITAKEFVLIPEGGHISVSGRGKMVMQEHQNILDSLLNGEAAQARQVMIQHLDQSLAAMLEVYRSQKRIREL